MRPVEPIELAAAPSITLAGKEYKIPKIVPRQNRIITPAVFGLMDVFVRAMAAVGQGSMAGFVITTDQYDQLMLIVHTALQRAHPEVTLEFLEDSEIGTIELLGSLIVIAQQAGCMPAKVPGPLAPGAAAPAAPIAQPTG